MMKFLVKFLRKTDGAITVDWVVLSALAVTLLASGYGLMESGTTDLSDATGDYMTSYTF